MHLPCQTIVAYLVLLPLVSAFYPSDPTWLVSRQSTEAHSVLPIRSLDVEAGVLTLPLRRTLIKRDSIYKIDRSKPPKQADSVAVDQDGTDMSYMVSVMLGSSSKQINLLLDSAASNTWVMGSSCKTDACTVHNTFGPQDSKTLVATSDPFEIYYGTGSVSGQVVTDTFRISSFSPILKFGLGTNVSSDFYSYPMDGILGVGRGADVPNSIKAPGLLDVLSGQKFTKTKMFGIHLSRTSGGLFDGELNFGGPNKARYDGNLNYMPILPNTNGFWEVPLDDLVVAGKNLGFEGRSAIIDSGTSFILMPKDDAVALHQLIPGSTQNGETFNVPCQTKPTLQFVFNGIAYNISALDLIGPRLDNDQCRTNIIGRQTFGDKEWLVGDVFLKNVYSVFDLDKSRVGFGIKGQEVMRAGASTASMDSSTTPTTTHGVINSGPSVTTTAESTRLTAESQRQAGASSASKGIAGRIAVSCGVSVVAIMTSMFRILL